MTNLGLEMHMTRVEQVSIRVSTFCYAADNPGEEKADHRAHDEIGKAEGNELANARQRITYQHIQHALPPDVCSQEDHRRGFGLDAADDGCLAP